MSKVGLSGIKSRENRARAGSVYRGKAAIFRVGNPRWLSWIVASRAFCIGKKCARHGGGTHRGFSTISWLCSHGAVSPCGANAIDAPTERGGYSVIEKPVTRELCPIILARHA